MTNASVYRLVMSRGERACRFEQVDAAGPTSLGAGQPWAAVQAAFVANADSSRGHRAPATGARLACDLVGRLYRLNFIYQRDRGDEGADSVRYVRPVEKRLGSALAEMADFLWMVEPSG